ncbi:MAG: 50S ribosomal protein L20 [Planctomycetes bacterium]|nr:50S ribosomal protein L20 [Planctomycetota bacterium]
MRARYTVAHHKKVKRIFKKAKGFRGGRSKLLRTASEAVDRSEAYSTRDRKQKKRQFRRLWITRINAAARQEGIKYGELMNGLKKAEITLDRKMLSELAINNKEAFSEVVKKAKAALEK